MKNINNSLKIKGVEKFRNVLFKNDFKSIQEIILSLFEKYGGKEFKKFDSKNFLNNDQFHIKAIELRKKNKVAFGKFYDVIQNTALIYKFFTGKKILNLIKNKLKISSDNLIIYPCFLRMDPPADERNSLDWHQDSLIEEINHSYIDAYTLWIPLQDVDYDNGSCFFCIGSQFKRYKKNLTKKNPRDPFTSKSLGIPDRIIQKFKSIEVPAKKGDVVAFTLNTLHKSGVNRSQKIRFTLICRVYNLNSRCYIPGKTTYIRSI